MFNERRWRSQIWAIFQIEMVHFMYWKYAPTYKYIEQYIMVLAFNCVYARYNSKVLFVKHCHAAHTRNNETSIMPEI